MGKRVRNSVYGNRRYITYYTYSRNFKRNKDYFATKTIYRRKMNGKFKFCKQSIYKQRFYNQIKIRNSFLFIDRLSVNIMYFLIQYGIYCLVFCAFIFMYFFLEYEIVRLPC